MLGWHKKKAQGEEGISESSSKLSLFQVSSTNQRAPGNCSHAASTQAEIDFKLHSITGASCPAAGLVGRDRQTSLLPGQGRELTASVPDVCISSKAAVFSSSLPYSVFTKEYD